MARLLTFGTFQRLRYQALSASTDPTLATIAARALKEATYHVDHARSWVVRLGDGTADSHRRMACGLAAVWPYVEELFTPAAVDGPLVAAGIAADVGTLRAAWDAELDAALAEATLSRPATPSAATTGRTAWGGRQGLHTEHLGPLLAVLQHLHRSHPGASW